MSRRSLLALLLLTSLLPACGDKTPPPGPAGPAGPSGKSKGTIGLSVKTMSNPFFKEIADAMKDEAAKHGFEVAVVSADNDVGKQQNQVKDFIVRKVAAIVLTPADSRAIGTAIKEANAAGIPVFTADIASTSEGAAVVSHIATDNYAGGQQAAIAMVEAIGGQGKIAILDDPEVESVQQRTKGFKEKLAELDPDKKIQIVATLPGGGARDVSFKATQDLMQSNPELVGIFAINDPSALGAVGALEAAGAGKLAAVKVIGFDGMPEGKRAIRDGKIYADPIQFPDQIARQTVKAIVAHFNGEKVEKQTLIPTALYRKKDAEADKSLK